LARATVVALEAKRTGVFLSSLVGVLVPVGSERKQAATLEHDYIGEEIERSSRKLVRKPELCCGFLKVAMSVG
jgi:hypothetical protein